MAGVGPALSPPLNLLLRPLLLGPTFRTQQRRTLKAILLGQGHVQISRGRERSLPIPRHSTLPPTLHVHRGHVNPRPFQTVLWLSDHEPALRPLRRREKTHPSRSLLRGCLYSRGPVPLPNQTCRLLVKKNFSPSSLGTMDL